MKVLFLSPSIFLNCRLFYIGCHCVKTESVINVNYKICYNGNILRIEVKEDWHFPFAHKSWFMLVLYLQRKIEQLQRLEK